MPNVWLRFSDAHVDVRHVAAIENGPFDQREQEFRAILVLDAGGRIPLHEFVPYVLERLDEARGVRGMPIVNADVDDLCAQRAIAAEHSGMRELLRKSTTMAPPPTAPPDLNRTMTYVDAITLARQFLALHEMPEPDELAWLTANAKTGLALARELARLFERHQEGTPIAGAGCS